MQHETALGGKQLGSRSNAIPCFLTRIFVLMFPAPSRLQSLVDLFTLRFRVFARKRRKTIVCLGTQCSNMQTIQSFRETGSRSALWSEAPQRGAAVAPIPFERLCLRTEA